MEFNTTQSFVKALEGVRDSGVLEDPLLTDVKEMIQMSYENGTIDEAIRFMNEKYDYYVINIIWLRICINYSYKLPKKVQKIQVRH